ncbi:MAG: hypothetical protein IPK39_13180 [Sulfuritalea sp.]|nr:hypothetical protein [Sulfuritalea sp.]
MTEDVENLILEHLKALRNELGDFRADTSDNFMQVKARLRSLAERLSLAEKGIANIHGDHALIQLRLDKQGDRLERIEKRLELIPA